MNKRKSAGSIVFRGSAANDLMKSLTETVRIDDQNLKVSDLRDAAPDLYRVAVKALFAAGAQGANADTNHPLRGLWEEARAAIKKAESRSGENTCSPCAPPTDSAASSASVSTTASSRSGRR